MMGSVRALRLMVLAAGLACRDLVRDFRMTLCLLAGVAAVISPLLVLFGLRYGVVEALQDELRRNPSTLELRPLTQGQFDAAFFARLQAQAGVAYLEPTPRFLSTILSLTNPRQPEGTEPVQVDMLPSREGDPLLSGLALAAPPASGLILSQVAAEKLGVTAGDTVTARIARVTGERRDVVSRPLVVAAILPLDRLRREAALLPPPFILACESFLEGYAAPLLGAEGAPPPERARVAAGFRLFAADIDVVEPLRQWLVGEGLQVATAAAEIRMVQRLDNALGLLFVIVAALGGVGAVLGLAVSLWGNVERKRHELGVMRLVGFPSGAMAAFPMVQAVVIALLGGGLSIGVALAAGLVVDRVLAGTVAAGLVTYRLPLWALLGTAGLSMAAAALAAAVAGLAASRLDPAETLRRV